MKSNHMSKLFGVLVLGGAVMAQAGDNVDVVEEETLCQVEVVKKSYSLFGELSSEVVTCVDDKTTEEIILLIEETDAPPLCGIWAG